MARDKEDDIGSANKCYGQAVCLDCHRSLPPSYLKATTKLLGTCRWCDRPLKVHAAD